MTFHFTKMHGLGNDFMVLDTIQQSIHLTPEDIQRLSCRHTGIGFDQCLLLEKSLQADIDFIYRIFNADGTEVGQCGNGARCIGRYIKRYGFSTKNVLKLATATTQLMIYLNVDGSVTVDMGVPIWQPEPCIMPDLKTHFLTLGNPHVVVLVDNIDTAPVSTLGPFIENHPSFPEKTNVGFLEIHRADHVKLRVYERGAGETNACGSGATAAVAVGRRFYGLAETVRVSLTGGDLTIHWPNMAGSLQMTGPACFVYEGTLMTS